VRSLITLIIILELTSCGTTKVITTSEMPMISRETTVPILKLPKKVQIQLPGEIIDDNALYIRYPREIKKNETFKAGENGGWMWENDDLQTLIYGLRSPWVWIDKEMALIESHNAKISKQLNQNKSWWKIW
jgi:hypothetical protein